MQLLVLINDKSGNYSALGNASSGHKGLQLIDLCLLIRASNSKWKMNGISAITWN